MILTRDKRLELGASNSFSLSSKKHALTFQAIARRPCRRDHSTCNNRWNNEFGIRCQTLRIYHIYTRPVWVECYTVRCYPEFCTHGMIVQDHFGYRAHGWNSIVDLYDVSVGDLKRRFVSSDLCTLLAYWFVVFTFHLLFFTFYTFTFKLLLMFLTIIETFM